MTIRELKDHLQRYLDSLDKYDDSEEIRLVNNTYFLYGATNILEIGSKGFVNLDNPLDKDEEEDW